MVDQYKETIRKTINDIPMELRVGAMLSMLDVIAEELPKAKKEYEELMWKALDFLKSLGKEVDIDGDIYKC